MILFVCKKLLKDNYLKFYNLYRCPPILDVLLRVLQASLAASRSQLSRHKAHHHLGERGLSESDMEELRTAVVATQESIAAQILLEACCELPEDRVSQLVKHVQYKSRIIKINTTKNLKIY